VIRLFCGYDQREAIGFHVFTASVLRLASAPVAITPLAAMGLPVGSNDFTLSRFLVPSLCGFEGFAVFADACDMLMAADIAELWALRDGAKAVQVVNHGYRTRNPVKYIGTSMQCPNLDYPRKNWASLMLINCGHPAWRGITAERIAAAGPMQMLQLRWLDDADIGVLPERWNRLVDEGQPVEDAAVLHWTAGVPAFPHYSHAPGAAHWHAELAALQELP